MRTLTALADDVPQEQGAKRILRTVKRGIIAVIGAAERRDFPPPWKPLPHESRAVDGRPKVLVLSHMFPHPDQPSSGPFVHEQVQALRRHAGIDARVLVGRPFWMTRRTPWALARAERVYRLTHDARDWLDLDGVPVMYLPYRIALPFWSQGWTYRASMLRAAQRIRREFPFDIVHAHTAYLDGSAGLAIARRFGAKLAITEHTGPFSILMENSIVRRWTIRSLSGASRIIAVSQAQRHAVMERLPPAARRLSIVLPNVVDTDLFHPPESWRPDPTAPRIVFVGYFVPIKNLPLLLEAFRIVLSRIAGARLTLVGGGENREQEHALAQRVREMNLSPQVDILGHQPRHEIARLLRESCDVLVLSSRSETFGCVLTEALSCGKPVVATRCGGPEDIISTAEVGMLCANDSATELAERLIEVCKNLPGYDPRVIRARAMERFGGRAVAEKIGEVYRSILALPDHLDSPAPVAYKK